MPYSGRFFGLALNWLRRLIAGNTAIHSNGSLARGSLSLSIFPSTITIVIVLVAASLTKAEERPGPAQLLQGLVPSGLGCLQKPYLNCADALELLQKTGYRIIGPTKIIASRSDPEFVSLFSSCNLAPATYSDDLDWNAVRHDPFYYEVTTTNHIEGQYLAYGPFAIYDVKLRSRKIRRIIEATGYKGLGEPLRDLHYFALQIPPHKCSLRHLGRYGYYDSDLHLASWGALISTRGNVYAATYQAWGHGKSGAIEFAPVSVAVTNRYSVARATVAFSALDPKDK